MDTLGPRIMVNVGTQAASTTALNPRDLAPLTNDAFLATFTGKTSLSASNGLTRQHNNYRQSFTTQMERVTIRTKTRPLTADGSDNIEPDSAILSIIRGNGSDGSQQQTTSQRQLQGTRNRRRSLNQQTMGNGWNDIPCSPNYRPTNDTTRRRRTRSGGAQQPQQISVVDQMAAQPHIPYAILPKRFEPKQVSNNGLSQQQQQSRSSNNNNNNNNTRNGGNRRRGGSRRRRPLSAQRNQRQQDYYDDQWEEDEDDLWLEPMMNRRFTRRSNRAPPAAYYGQRMNNYYDSYSYGPMSRQGQFPMQSRRRMPYPTNTRLPFDIVPTYDLNEWQGPYARSRQNLYMQQQQRNGFRSGNGFIRDDYRTNGTTRQTRNGKQSKSPRNTKGQQKRRTSRQRKQRNQNSKTEGTPLTTTNDVKSTNETETSTEEKQKQENNVQTEQEQPLPPRNDENKENNGEQKSD